MRPLRCCRSRRAAAVVVAALSIAPLAAQCGLQWQHGVPVGGVDGDVHVSLRWDPDGTGPLTPVVVLGGRFAAAGGVVAANIVAWDPATGTFAPFGAGLGLGGGGWVRSLAIGAYGELLAGGSFQQSGSVVLDNLARWNGTSWSAFGIGPQAMQGEVPALAALPNGDIVIGGSMSVFTSSSISVQGLARWDGTAWYSMGTVGGVIHTLLPHGGGVIVGGEFSNVGTALTSGIAFWSSSGWSTYGGGVTGPGAVVLDVVVLPNGDLVAGGTFTTAGTAAATNVARWNGSAWSAMGAGVPAPVRALAVLSSGDVVAAVTPPVPGTHFVRRWNGAAWVSIATVDGQHVRTLEALPGGDLVLGGDFSIVSGAAVSGIAHWDGGQWSALTPGATGSVSCCAVLPNGEIVLGGSFTGIGVLSRNVVQRTSSGWLSLGGGTNSSVVALAVLPDGRVVAGGAFTTAGSVAASNVASWDGVSWAPLGAGPGPTVQALAVLGNGELIAGGSFGSGSGQALARWNGQSWVAMGGATGVVQAMLALPGNRLVVGGYFASVGGVAASHVASWDGASWSPLGLGLPGAVNALARAPNGDLVAATATVVWRWNGATWTPLGLANAGVVALECAPNGDVFAGGWFTTIGGVPATRIARWRDATATWSPLGSGANLGFGLPVRTLRMLGDDAMLVGGGFSIVDGVASAAAAQLRPACAAAVATYGTGCAGLARTNTLAAVTDPWLGTTFRTIATGLPASAFGVRALGLTTQSTPLAALMPLGGAGCDLLVSPDLLDAFWLAGGPLTLDLPIPNVPALVGATFHQQAVVAELSPAGAIVRLTSSNALTATIGTW